MLLQPRRWPATRRFEGQLPTKRPSTNSLGSLRVFLTLKHIVLDLCKDFHNRIHRDLTLKVSRSRSIRALGYLTCLGLAANLSLATSKQFPSFLACALRGCCAGRAELTSPLLTPKASTGTAGHLLHPDSINPPTSRTARRLLDATTTNDSASSRGRRQCERARCVSVSTFFTLVFLSLLPQPVQRSSALAPSIESPHVFPRFQPHRPLNSCRCYGQRPNLRYRLECKNCHSHTVQFYDDRIGGWAVTHINIDETLRPRRCEYYNDSVERRDAPARWATVLQLSGPWPHHYYTLLSFRKRHHQTSTFRIWEG